MKVKVFLENESKYKPEFKPADLAKKVITHVLKRENCNFDCEVNLTVTSLEGIRSMNKEFRNLDKPTDVLSFPAVDFEKPGDFEALQKTPQFRININPDTGNFMLGDIMICSDKVISQAEEYGHSELREFAFLIAHSTLHLIGYDHMEKSEAKVMENKQSTYLNELEITR